MQYAELKNLDRFDTYADLKGVYARGTRGQFNATFRDYVMKEATPEIEALIREFRRTYEFVIIDREWEYPDDNDELGTGSCVTTYDYRDIGEDCVFLLYEGRIVGVTSFGHDGNMPVVWFHENNPGYHLHDDIAFHLKKQN